MIYEVVVQNWHENSIGEQGSGPKLVMFRSLSEEEALKYAASKAVVRKETASGGAYGTWTHVRKAFCS